MRNSAPTVNAQMKFAWNLVSVAPISLGGAAFLTALAGLPLQSDLALVYRIISVFAVVIAVWVIARWSADLEFPNRARPKTASLKRGALMTMSSLYVFQLVLMCLHVTVAGGSSEPELNFIAKLAFVDTATIRNCLIVLPASIILLSMIGWRFFLPAGDRIEEDREVSEYTEVTDDRSPEQTVPHPRGGSRESQQPRRRTSAADAVVQPLPPAGGKAGVKGTQSLPSHTPRKSWPLVCATGLCVVALAWVMPITKCDRCPPPHSAQTYTMSEPIRSGAELVKGGPHRSGTASISKVAPSAIAGQDRPKVFTATDRGRPRTSPATRSDGIGAREAP